jgi:hypothetical protein
VNTGEATPIVILDSPVRTVPTPVGLDLVADWRAGQPTELDTAVSLDLTASAPNQARAPRGTPIGGQWIDTPGGMLADVGATGGDAGQVSIPVGEHTFSGSVAEPHGRESDIQANGYSTPTLIRAPKGDPESSAAFQAAIQRAKDGNPYGASVYVYDLAEYEDMDLWLTEDGTAGIALHNGDIVSGFNEGSNPANKGFVLHGMATAQAAGGTRADAFDTVLPDIYAKAGMEVVGRVPWDDDYAPDGWDYEQFAKFNGGRPDVVFMKANPDGWWGTYTPGQGQVVESYEDGQALTASVEGHVDGLVVPLPAASGVYLSLSRVGTQKPLHELLAIRLSPSHPDILQTQPGNTYTPAQARAPKGTEIGGQWIDTPAGLLTRVSPLGPYGDEVTAALGTPGAPRTYEEMAADPVALVAEVNPGRMDRLNGEDFRYNCQRTVMATEMRARGYDVVAPGASGNDGTLWEVQHKWILPERNPDGSNIPAWSEKENGYDDAMIGGPGNVGKRFIMAGAFPGFGGMAGHVWNAEVRADGTVIHLDAQGSVMKDLGIDIDKMTDVQWMRVDNAAPVEDMWRLPDYDADPYAPPAWIMTSGDFAEDYEMQYEQPLAASALPNPMVYNDCVPTPEGWVYVGDIPDMMTPEGGPHA